MTSPQIGEALFIDSRTVDAHIVNSCSKLGVRTRLDMVVKLFGASDAADHKKTNIMPQLTSFVGRETQVADILSMLRDSRLVTLTGAGGVGKTRTALAMGRAIPEIMAPEVWLVEFAPLAKGSLVSNALANVLGVRDSPPRPLLDEISIRLRKRPMVLIFDNCEHVRESAAALARDVLSACPNVRIIATSREPLGIAIEEAYRLPSLRVPISSARLSAAAAAAFSAVRLFVERAQTADAHFTLTGSNAAIVAELCRRLDGIPLAIELAAARTKTIPAPLLLAQLDTRLEKLRNANRKALPRHQTMTALIDWSYDLLTLLERRLFERLSIFSGDCGLAAIKAVCADDDVDDLQIEALLASLVEKSLCISDFDADGAPRYRLLSVFRHYAFAKLEQSGQAVEIARRHAITYTDIADRFERAHDDGSAAEWFERAERELGNWRAALEWAIDARGDIVLGKRLAAALRPVWTSFSIAEGRRWIQAARSSSADDTPAKVAADLDYAAAGVAYAFAEWDVSLAASMNLISQYQELGDRFGVARARYLAGTSLVILGRSAEGEDLLSKTLATARNLGKPRLVAFTLQSIAEARANVGDLSAARDYLAEALESYKNLGADRYVATAAGSLAEIEFRTGNAEKAIDLTLTMLATLRSLSDTLYITKALNNVAAYFVASGRPEDARVYALEALDLARETLHDVDLAFAIQHLAGVAALSSAKALHDKLGALDIVARLVGYVDGCIAALGSSREYSEQQEYDRLKSLLAGEMPPERLARLLFEGSQLRQGEATAAARALVGEVAP